MIVAFLQKIIRLYAYIVSPFLGRNCRFEPTCSCYAHQALERHGALKGIYLTICRVLNCQPFSKRNWHDPVPERFAWRDFLGYKRSTPIKQPEQKTFKVQKP